MTKLFVGGFPLEFNELDIVMLIAPHADVSTIKVVRDKKTKICKGYAFLEVADRAAAEAAIEAVDGTKVQGRLLSVNIREDEPVVPVRKSFSRPYPANNANRVKRPRR